MATVEQQSTGTIWSSPQEVEAILKQHGIVYEQWDISKLNDSRPSGEQSTEAHILDVFSDEIEAISKTRGYESADVVALHPNIENLDDILETFDREHTHGEDEVRFTVAGRGIFAIRGVDDDVYSVEVHPGDLLAVPEGTQHYFTLCDDRQIQCIRLFTDTSGWEANYVDNGASAEDIEQAPSEKI